MKFAEAFEGLAGRLTSDPELRDAVENFRPLVPAVEGLAKAEARAFFEGAVSAVEAGDLDLSKLRFAERIKLQEAITEEGRHEALRVEARRALLADALAVSGKVGLVALKLLLSALVPA